MDWRACHRMAKLRRKTNQHARKILHWTQKMGIYLPNLCHFYEDQEAPRSHGKIPWQAENIRKKHFGRQIRVFRADEGQRIHGRKRARGVQEPILEFRVDDFWVENKDHLLAMHSLEVFPEDQTKNESWGELNSALIFGKDPPETRELVQAAWPQKGAGNRHDWRL